MDEIRVGYIPLADCALLIAAETQGFARQQGLHLRLSQEPSWATIRDKVAFGLLDAAQMLAPLPLAMQAGLGGQLPVPMVAPLGLGDGGNAITLSVALYQEMQERAGQAGVTLCGTGPAAARIAAQMLAQVAADRHQRKAPPLRLASVYPFSCHYFELRLWLASGGADAGHIEFLTIPPARMVDNLQNGLIDGFCVGEPWNLLAQTGGCGVIVATKQDIAPQAPEKVLGLTRRFADAHPDRVGRLCAALLAASDWASRHPAELARLLAGSVFPEATPALLEQILTVPPVSSATPVPHFTPAARPLDLQQCDWLAGQMERWWSGVPLPDAAALRTMFAAARSMAGVC